MTERAIEITHEVLEAHLKKMFDKLKNHLCLKFSNDDYVVMLSDGLAGDAYILNGDTVTIKIRTKVFSDAITKRGLGTEFRQLMEHCLRQVPRMRVTLTHQPPAEVMMFDDESRRMKKVTKAEYDKLHPKHTYEKELHYEVDVRTTVIHWKTGTIIREFASTHESSRNKARRRMLTLLNDPEIYNRVGDEFVVAESHDDIIHDLVIQASILSPEEKLTLIKRLGG